ncbi:MAG: 16S rRNA processing protein RimM [Vallitaleaceae bacterium]|nr:16S rRNA processing protein RimM [Vallitaleaceae bacterium]
MIVEDFLYIGRVANTHGVQGGIKVVPTTDDPSRFDLLEKVYLEDTKGVTTCYTIASVKYQQKFVLLTFKEIKDMDSAMALKLSIVKIPRDQALPLEEGEFYISDLMGIEVYDEAGQKLGPIKDIIFTGSNEVYVVDDGSKNGLLLPAIKQCIKSIDINQHKMIVTVLEGLLNE